MGCPPDGVGSDAAAAVAATNGAAGAVDPKAQDLQFLFLAMTEEVGAGWSAGYVLPLRDGWPEVVSALSLPASVPSM